MKDNNVIQQKSYAFAVNIVKLYQVVTSIKKEFVLSRQLLRCGTSIGANVEEAIGGQSRADFLSKLSIAYKEARETKYWLRLLHDTGYINSEDFNTLYSDADELCRIIAAIQKSMKNQR